MTKENIGKNLSTQKEVQAMADSATLESQKILAQESMKKLKDIQVQLEEQLKQHTKECEEYENKGVLKPLQEFVDEQVVKIGKIKKANVLTGLGIGVAVGVATVLIKHFSNKKGKI